MKPKSPKCRNGLALKILSRILLFAALGTSVAQAVLIPPDRLYVGWTNAGVPGGIPNSSNMTVYTTITSTGNTTDRTATINNAIAACPVNQVVVLGPGTFRVNGQISMNNRSGVVVRGSGVGVTIISSYHSGAWGWIVGNTSSDYEKFGGASLSADEAAGQTVLSMASTTSYAVGDRVSLHQDDSRTAAWPVLGSSGPARNMRHGSKIVAKTTTTITLADPLPFAFTTAQRAVVHVVGDGFAVRCGIENLTFDMSNGGPVYGISLWNADECWLKNLEIKQAANYLVFMLKALHCTMEKCYLNGISGTGSNGSGLIIEQSSLNLMQDCIVRFCFPNVEINFGCTGNVFGYNALLQSQGEIGLDGNHGAHNAFNLFEGNVAPNLKPDGYFGSVSHDTALRNRLTGADDIGGAQNFPPINLKRFTRYYNVVGNVLGLSTSAAYEQTAANPSGTAIYQLGYPNIGNESYSGTASPLAGDWWADWPNGAIPSGYQERDLDVSATLIRKGNYNTANQGVPASESLGGDTVPNSYYLTSRPSWFGNLTWPPFDATAAVTAAYRSSLTASYLAIPAGYRYINGVNPPAGPVNLPPVAVASGNPLSGVAPVAVTFSSVGSLDPEGTTLTRNWSFGDGTPNSTAANPSHTYPVDGTYVARLTVSDGTNTTTSSDLTIRVGNQSPVAVASAVPVSGVFPLPVTFSSAGSLDPEGTPLTYSWNFGDGSSLSTAANPSHTYQAAGAYTARLTVSDGVKTTSSSNLVVSVFDPANTLVAAYGFEEGSGATVADGSSNGNSGTVSGATWTTAGKYGKALSFNGVNALVVIPYSNSLNVNNAMTESAWVYPTASKTGWTTVLHRETDAYYLHASSPDGAMVPAAGGIFSGTESYGAATGALPLNTWTYLAATYDGTNLKVYVNGVLSSTKAISGTIQNNSNPLRIGGNVPYGQFFEGRIDDVRVYNRALSLSEIQADMATPVGGGGAKPGAPTNLRVVTP